MKDLKNYLIAILAGLLVLTLSTRSAQSAPKQYDAVKLVEYADCLSKSNNGWGSADAVRLDCSAWKPK
jgi:hypothetical protein